jgi:hypothetical protein
MDHRYLIQTLGNNNVNRCLETSDKWQLQRNFGEIMRIKMNQMSKDVQNNLVPLHPVHIQNHIYSLTFQDDEAGQKHSPDKLKWNCTDHMISNHSTLGSGNEIRYRCSPESKLSLLSTGWAHEVM